MNKLINKINDSIDKKGIFYYIDIVFSYTMTFFSFVFEWIYVILMGLYYFPKKVLYEIPITLVKNKTPKSCIYGASDCIILFFEIIGGIVYLIIGLGFLIYWIVNHVTINFY